MTLTLPTPKFISFDIYGTLIHFELRRTVEPIVAARLGDRLEAFFHRFKLERYDAVMEHRPYDEVLELSYRRTCERFGLEVTSEDVQAVTTSLFGWGPHADVPAPLAKLASRFPLVAISNADDRHLADSIPKLVAPFHAVLTAEQAGAYKPRLRAYDHLVESLGCEPQEIMHIASHQLYDHVPMAALGFTNKVFLDRGYDPHLPEYGAVRVTSLDEVVTALGIG